MEAEVSGDVRRCWGCEAALPPHRPKWCSQRCAQNVLRGKYEARQKRARDDALRHRKCVQCGGAMSVEMKAYAKFCSAKCRKRAETIRTFDQRKKYREDNREKVNKLRNEWGKKNRAKDTARQRRWRKENEEHVIAYRKEHYQNNKGYYFACSLRRRRKVKQATPSWLTDEQFKEIAKMYETANALGLHVDHIVPLQGENVSGLNVPWNMRLIPGEVNRAKSNKHVP